MGIAVADFNRDGKPDVTAVNVGTGAVSILFGNGKGTLEAIPGCTTGLGSYVTAVGDFNGDGRPDFVTPVNYHANVVVVCLNQSNGTFVRSGQFAAGMAPTFAIAGDFNGDGKLDVAVGNSDQGGSIGVLLGNGNGTFLPVIDTPVSGLNFVEGMAAGDFNGDGKLDLAVGYLSGESSPLSILLGNGDGTFVVQSTPFGVSLIAAGDVNGDGILDLATTGSILLGNGDGTFRQGSTYSTYPTCTTVYGSTATAVIIADLNHDGKPDVVLSVLGLEYPQTGCVDVLLGNGDGTFQSPVPYQTGVVTTSATVGDFNGDGNPDIAIGNGSATSTVGVFLGNGDGTFQPLTLYPVNNGVSFITAMDVNGDGVDDAVVASSEGSVDALLSQGRLPAVSLSPSSLNFGDQQEETTSPPQTVTLTNTGAAKLTITAITLTGTNSGDFAQTNTCGMSVQAGASCTISVTFTPAAEGIRSAALSVADNAFNSPQTVSLTGVGVEPAVKFSPTSLAFPTQVIFTRSRTQKLTLTNPGTGTLNITSLAATGNFAESNTCGSSVAPGASCTIAVSFLPLNKGVLSGAVSITDNAPGSPQTVPLRGTGTFVQLKPTSLAFGNQPVGTTSFPQTIEFSNQGLFAVNISDISITGVDKGDFAETNTCGSSVARGAGCVITVTFTPQALGARTARVSIIDNGGGSPQTVTLTGSGTP